MKQLTKEQEAKYSEKLSIQSRIMRESLGKLTIRDINSLEWVHQYCKDMLNLLQEIFNIVYADEID